MAQEFENVPSLEQHEALVANPRNHRHYTPGNSRSRAFRVLAPASFPALFVLADGEDGGEIATELGREVLAMGRRPTIRASLGRSYNMIF